MIFDPILCMFFSFKSKREYNKSYFAKCVMTASSVSLCGLDSSDILVCSSVFLLTSSGISIIKR